MVILLRGAVDVAFRPGDHVAGCLRNVSSTYVPALTRHGRRHQRHQRLERLEFHEQLIDWQTALSPADLAAATTAIAARAAPSKDAPRRRPRTSSASLPRCTRAIRGTHSQE